MIMPETASATSAKNKGMPLAESAMVAICVLSPIAAKKNAVRTRLQAVSTLLEDIAPAIMKAMRAVGIVKPVNRQTLCKSFATRLLQAVDDTRTAQELLGYKDVSTMPI